MTVRRVLLQAALIVSVCSLTIPARAAGIDDLLSAAMENDPAIASASTRADRGAADVALARSALLPRLTASAGYTRNQVAAEVTLPGADPVVITPLDQLEASARLEVPLWDGAAFAGARAADRCRDAAEARAEAVIASALLDVVRAAWDARSADAAVDASKAAVEGNQQLLAQARSREAQGTASSLDVLRATADLERAKEDLALASADASAARRRLAARTGSTDLPALSARAAPNLRDVDGVPSLRAAEADARCRGSQVAQQRWAYSPRVSAFAQERVTNATGFAKQAGTYAVGVEASWSLFDGGGREARIDAANADLRESDAELRVARRAAEDALANATVDLEAASTGLDSARARHRAAAEAVRVAQERFAVGLGPAVDVTLAVRDDRDAAVALARAEARQAVAVESVRAAVGQPLAGAR